MVVLDSTLGMIGIILSVLPILLLAFRLFLDSKNISISRHIKDGPTMSTLFDGWQAWQRDFGGGVSRDSIVDFNSILHKDGLSIGKEEMSSFLTIYSSMRDDAATLFFAGKDLIDPSWNRWIREHKKEIAQFKDFPAAERIRYYIFCFEWLDRVTRKNTFIRGEEIGDTETGLTEIGVVAYKMLYACSSLLESFGGNCFTEQALGESKTALHVSTR